MYETILLATDGSDPARAAARHANLLARTLDATIHVVTVEEDGEVSAGAATGVAELLGETRTETVTRTGRPADEILAYAREVDADLIAAGTHGRRGIRRAVAGSVAERIVRRAGKPVVTVRDSDPEPDAYERILLPTDGSTDAERVTDHATELARAFDATVRVLSVIDVNTVASQSELTNPSVITDELSEQADRATERVADRVREAGVEATTDVVQGTPSNAIVEYAAEEECDLITMATHGRTGLERVLIGSTTERTIRRATVPVLSLGPDREE